MNYIVYLAYGKRDFAQEAIYSILSLYYAAGFEEHKEISIVIYTDQIGFFRQAFGDNDRIIYQEFTESMSEAWMEGGYVHRAKIKLLQDCMEKYPGNLLFVDTDTIFIQNNLEELFCGINRNRFLLYALENSLAQRMIINQEIVMDINEQNSELALLRFIKDNSFITEKGKEIKIPLTMEMWNSGVIGINMSHVPLLDDVLELIDTVYEKFQYRILEQFALSYIYGQNGTVYGADDTVHHYWYSKITRYIIINFFKKLQESGQFVNCPLAEDFSLAELYDYEQEQFAPDIKNYGMEELYDMEHVELEYEQIIPYGAAILKYFWDMKFLMEWVPESSFFGNILSCAHPKIIDSYAPYLQ